MPFHRTLCVVAALSVQACTSIQLDTEISAVSSQVDPSGQRQLVWVRTPEQASWVKDQVNQLLSKPMTVDVAVDIALLNNQGLQSRLAQLGIGKAEFEQSSRLPNPGFRFGRFTSGDEREIERSVHINVLRVLLMPLTQKAEQQRLLQNRFQTASDVLSLTAKAQRAYYESVAATQLLDYAKQVLKAAQASHELAKKMEQAGNFSALQKAREQGFYADAVQGVTRAQNYRTTTFQVFIRLLGLPANTVLLLPERLPDLPTELASESTIQSLGLTRRLDVQSEQMGLQYTADILGLTKATRFITVFDLGGIRDTSTQTVGRRGYEMGIELPIFDSGEARLARAEAVYRQAMSQTQETIINANSEIIQSFATYQAAYAMAKYQREEIVPLRQRILDENLLRYNGMFIGVFELLAEARAQVNSVSAYIELLRDFWISQVQLNQSLTGKPLIPNSVGQLSSGSSQSTSANAGH